MPPARFTWYNFIALVVALAFALFPIFWIASTALKPLSEWVTTPPTWVPAHATFDNFEALFGSRLDLTLSVRDSVVGPLINSIVVSVVATVLAIVIGALAALAFSRYRIGGSFLPLSILGVRMIPPILLATPLLILFGELGLRDTQLGLILVYTALTVPIATWMLKSFIDAVPVEIEEAAMMDGLSRWAAHLRVTLPLIKGGIAATTTFVFILNWSEFLMALVLSDKNAITLPILLRMYEGGYGAQSALAVIAVIPLLIAAFAIQKYLVRGLTFGMIKQ